MGTTHTMQSVWAHSGETWGEMLIPAPELEVVPGVYWGRAEEILSPAFWKYQASTRRRHMRPESYRIGRSLLEEVSVCLLGGYGMPAEIGLAAFERLSSLGLLNGYATQKDIEEVLMQPFVLNGRQRHFRFARQKSRYLSSALSELRETALPSDQKECRDYLTTLDGIGPKTASWIVRNYFASDAVAILDVHIIRAGTIVGLFEPNDDPSRKYYQLENRFLDFCRAMDEPASLIDALMWDFMRRIGPTTSHGIGRTPYTDYLPNKPSPSATKSRCGGPMADKIAEPV